MNTATQVQSAPNAGMVAAQLAALEEHQYLTFVLGTEVFAIGILGIKEIIEYEGLTAVPMMPSHIGGVINLRGAVVPVMDRDTARHECECRPGFDLRRARKSDRERVEIHGKIARSANRRWCRGWRWRVRLLCAR